MSVILKRDRDQMNAVLLFLLVVSETFIGGCSEHMVRRRTVEQEFNDQRIVALARAACAGDRSAVAREVAAGANPNFEGVEGLTPLTWAVTCGNLEGMQALLDAGADPNHKAAQFWSPVYQAARSEDPAPLRLLLQHGGDPNAYVADDVSDSALWAALGVGVDGHGWDNYYALLNADADINRADRVGHTIATQAAALNSV